MGDMYKSTYDTDNNGAIDLTAGGTNVYTQANALIALGIQQHSTELDALAALASTALIVRSASATYLTRTITAGTGSVTVTNGSGVSGNPTIDFPNLFLLSGTQTVTGNKTFSGQFNTDAISERTAANGVSIDGVKFLDSFLENDKIVEPIAPSANKIRYYTKDLSGNDWPYFINSESSTFQVGISANNMWLDVMGRQNGAIFPQNGSSAITQQGLITLNANSFSSTRNGFLDDKFGVYNRTAFSAAGASAYFFIHTSSVNDRIGELLTKPYFFITFRLSANTTYRSWFCLTAATGSSGSKANVLELESPTSATIGLRFSPGGSGDSTFKFVATNGTTQTTVDSGVTFTAGKLYQFLMFATSGTSVNYSLLDEDGVVLGSTIITTNLPTSTTDLGAMFGLEPTASSTTVSFDLFNVAVTNAGYETSVVPK